MTARLAAAIGIGLALGAGCGRLGFADVPAPDGAAGDSVTVILTSDEYLAEPAGKPIAGATVLVERAGGTDRLTTDLSGMARFPADGALACHVIYKSDLGWRGYTIAPPLMAAASTIELGSRPATNANHNLTFMLPASANATQFTVRVPLRCAVPPTSSTASVATPFDASCEGGTVHAFGFALPTAGSSLPAFYVDAGAVALVNNTTIHVGGSYVQLPTRMLQVTNLPAATSNVSAELFQRSGLDLTSLTPDPPITVGNGTSATLQLATAPGGGDLWLAAFGAEAAQLFSTSQLIAPLGLAASTSFDARAMLPLISSLSVSDPARMTWTGGDGGTITIVERSASGVQWDWYLPASATSAALPAIPDDLGVPQQKAVDFATVTKLGVPGALGGDLLPTIDRRWSLWPTDAMLFPQAGAAKTWLLYSASRGP